MRLKRLVEIQFHSKDIFPKDRSFEGPEDSKESSDSTLPRHRAESHWDLTHLPSATNFQDERGAELSEAPDSASERAMSSNSEAAPECSEDKGERAGDRQGRLRSEERRGETGRFCPWSEFPLPTAKAQEPDKSSAAVGTQWRGQQVSHCV